MSHNRFISRTLSIEVQALRYRHHNQRYEIKALIQDTADGLPQLPAQWIYVESYDRDIKRFAEKYHWTPAHGLRWLHKCVREDKKRKISP